MSKTTLKSILIGGSIALASAGIGAMVAIPIAYKVGRESATPITLNVSALNGNLGKRNAGYYGYLEGARIVDKSGHSTSMFEFEHVRESVNRIDTDIKLGSSTYYQSYPDFVAYRSKN